MSTTRYVDIDRTIENLHQTKLCNENVDALHDFANHCAAEGISEVRQTRLISAWKTLITNFAPESFQLRGASKAELKHLVAGLNRSDYKESTKHTLRCAVKKFYKLEHDGHEEPDKTKFFSVGSPGNGATVSREDLFTEEELKRLFNSFTSTRDRAFAMVMYESGARIGETLALNIGDFTAKDEGDFIFLEGLKDTPDRTNQLVRAGRPLREWLAQHPLGGEFGDITDPAAPLWVKTEQQACRRCGVIPHNHDDSVCDYEPDSADRLPYDGFYNRFKRACEKANIPENKQRPTNLRHTRLTEVAAFMGYEQLNKFAGWVPGSDRAKVYVHLTSDDVNQAIRDEYGLDGGKDVEQTRDCPFCGATNQAGHTECRQCGRPMNLEEQVNRESQMNIIDRLDRLEEALPDLDGSPATS